MTQIDFAIAFFLLISISVFSISFISSSASNDFNQLNSEKIEEAVSSISTQLFDVKDNKSLVSNFKQIGVKFTEIAGLSHSSDLDIEITPEVNKVHVYDKMFNEIGSSVTSLSGKTKVSFILDFAPNEEKYVNIIYDGYYTTNIDYTSNVTEINVTSIIISEKEIFVLSKERCSQLKSLNYEDSKNLFGFTENFRISNECVYGPDPSPDANVIVKTIPVLVEKIDESIRSEKIKLLVW